VTPRLVLASSSPARLATLRAAGIEPTVIASHVDETVPTGTATDAAVELLAARKAEAVASTLQPDGSRLLVVGCDSLLELDGVSLGKPGTAASARQRWRAMRGRTAVLHTGHHVVDLPSSRRVAGTASVGVTFAPVSEEEIEAYVGTTEPLNVAGGFTIDGKAGAFVDSIEGDPHAVVGISLPLLRRLLIELGVRWTDLWTVVEPSR
jgi:septum formation protein